VKIKLEVEVELYDWQTQGRMFLREHVADLNAGKGRKFGVFQSIMTFLVEHDGTRRVAQVNLSPLTQAMANALLDNAKQIDAEKKSAA
jgi:hypothetical protein